ncbi:DUF4870 domain-containing protein [Candidatus Poribacteria bacterium]|nr:DUF4870 domain-containing protein [Candidatus Poribacteria bacterium]
MEDYGGRSFKPAVPPGTEERMLALFAHLLGLLTLFVGPAVIWAVKKNESEFIANNALQATVFQLAITGMMFLAYAVTCCFFGIGSLFPLGLSMFYVYVACTKVSEGFSYEYPLVGSLVKQPEP